MLKQRLFLFILLTGATSLNVSAQKPKLVVGIVVDQMRYDYLYRYASRYGNGGFKRLLNEGFNLHDCNYNYMPTYTGPGHASIYTGCTPAVHGIVANDWYDRQAKANVYCVNDTTYKSVGTNGTHGNVSPRRMLTSTIGDELRINTVKKSRVYGIALKDRASVLPAGHSANAAFWFDETYGKWISSTYYFKEGDKGLPAWFQKANEKSAELFTHHLNKKWETLYPIESYTSSIADNNPYERPFRGETAPVFPHDLPAVKTANNSFSVLKATPFGSTATKDFAKMLIENEKLGMGTTTDMLCISFSSPDYVGHQFGPSSIEMEDTYLRLDKDLEDLLKFLDEKIGKGKYTLFLTADHGAVEVPDYLNEFKIPGGVITETNIENGLDTLLEMKFGKELKGERYVLSYSNQQVYLNESLVKSRNLDWSALKKEAMNYLLTLPEVATVHDEDDMQHLEYTKGMTALIQNGYQVKRSGNIMVNYRPGVIEYGHQGTTHGSPYTYDTHVPLVFFGCGITKGESSKPVTITQIAPTICNLLKIPFPNGGSDGVIEFK